MVKEASALFKDINFDLKLLECLICALSTQLFNYGTFGVWAVWGWTLNSMAFIFGYIFENPNVWMEMLFLLTYFAIMVLFFVKAESAHASILLPGVAAAVLMVVDAFVLFLNRKRNEQV